MTGEWFVGMKKNSFDMILLEHKDETDSPVS